MTTIRGEAVARPRASGPVKEEVVAEAMAARGVVVAVVVAAAAMAAAVAKAAREVEEACP